MLKLKISSCTDERCVEAHEFERLWSGGSSSRVRLVESYEDADVILVTDAHHRNIYADILARPQHVRHYNKLICYSESDFPPEKIPGIYASASEDVAGSRGAPYYFWLLNRKLDFALNKKNERPYLFSFMGRNCVKVRGQILGMSLADSSFEYLLEDTTRSFPRFNAVKNRSEAELQKQKEHYLDVLMKSRFVLAPRGAGLSSVRLYEAMSCGCVPVIIADKLRLPFGVDWRRCSVRVPESEVVRLPETLKSVEPEFDQMSAAALATYEKLMEPKNFRHYIEDAVIDIYHNDMRERATIGALRRAIVSRYIRRTVYRRKNDLKRAINACVNLCRVIRAQEKQ